MKISIMFIKLIAFSFFIFVFFVSCGEVENPALKQMKEIEVDIENPTSEEEILNAIDKYNAKVLEVQAENAQIGIWHKLLGVKYLEQKMYGKALESFQRAIEFYPDNKNLYYYVGLCAGYMAVSSLDYQAEGKNSFQRYNYLKLSEESYLNAIKFDNKYVEALYGLSVIYVFYLEQSELAIPHLENLLNIDSKHTDAMFVLAHAYCSTYQYEKAVLMYDKIVHLTKSEEKKKQAEENKQKILEAQFQN